MGFVSEVLDRVDDCAELYNFLFVDYKIDKINQEINYLEKISNNPIQIRNYFLEYASQMNAPLKIWYIQNMLKCSDEALKEELNKMYQILIIRKNQIMQYKIDTKPVKLVSNVCKAIE